MNGERCVAVESVHRGCACDSVIPVCICVCMCMSFILCGAATYFSGCSMTTIHTKCNRVPRARQYSGVLLRRWKGKGRQVASSSTPTSRGDGSGTSTKLCAPCKRIKDLITFTKEERQPKERTNKTTKISWHKKCIASQPSISDTHSRVILHSLSCVFLCVRALQSFLVRGCIFEFATDSTHTRVLYDEAYTSLASVRSKETRHGISISRITSSCAITRINNDDRIPYKHRKRERNWLTIRGYTCFIRSASARERRKEKRPKKRFCTKLQAMANGKRQVFGTSCALSFAVCLFDRDTRRTKCTLDVLHTVHLWNMDFTEYRVLQLTLKLSYSSRALRMRTAYGPSWNFRIRSIASYFSLLSLSLPEQEKSDN